MTDPRLRDYADRPWPLRRRVAKALHHQANRLAWRYAGRPGYRSRVRSNHVLWRLNDWLADQWVPWWIRHG